VTSWVHAHGSIVLDRPAIMGILNVTPDSFSDGGRFVSVDRAISHAEAMLKAGADIIDVGGESTRPQGATQVEADEEIRRIGPVVREIHRRFPRAVISVDTVKSRVAREALEEGAAIINDVSALRLDTAMATVVAAAGAGLVLMHSRGTVTDMATYVHATYPTGILREVKSELHGQVRVAEKAGVRRQSIVLDPGIGFSKRSEQSLELLARLRELVADGYPVLIGVSRKRFVGELSRVNEAEQRIHGTTGANVMALVAGARIFRVHDVPPARQALNVAWAILQQTSSA
jgi:dihydropteroate synthase